jgi:hypothetical protein
MRNNPAKIIEIQIIRSPFPSTRFPLIYLIITQDLHLWFLSLPRRSAIKNSTFYAKSFAYIHQRWSSASVGSVLIGLS